jgi:NAD(P)-dependent dehydrogenase (short-subunit alcohol dehydrogenase family)
MAAPALSGSVAIVTGGATGIGREVCLALARAGTAVVVVNYSSSEDAAHAVVEELEALGCLGVPMRADVADDAATRAMVEATVAEHGRLDVLVNNAGVTRLVPFEDLEGLTDDAWRHVLDVNLLGPFHCARAAAPALRQARGAIVNVASIAAERAVGSSIAYGASKAGLLALTRGLARALAPEVRVNAVSPGTVTTRWHEQLVGPEQAARAAAAEAERVPLKAVPRPEQVAEAVMALVTSSAVTGESLIVDGGKHILF